MNSGTHDCATGPDQARDQAWTIGYGAVQAAAPALVCRSNDGVPIVPIVL